MACQRSRRTILVVNLLLLALAVTLWPRAESRSNRRRPGSVGPLHLQWSIAYPRPRPAWPDQPKLQFDAAYQPVIANELALVASAQSDSVTALDLHDGAERWRFVADGPVRFAPLVWEERVYFVSDDGHLYCLALASGELQWKVRGGPSGRLLLGNGRLISTWPARGAPVVADGVVYFAAGIWPFMGIFLHAVDARSGQRLWSNDGDGSLYHEQPHHAEAHGGAAPQGRLAVHGDALLVPGRSVPACYDRRTGRLRYFHLADYGRSAGGFQVQTNGRIFINGGTAFDLQDGNFLGQVGEPALLVDQVLYAVAGYECQAFDAAGAGDETPPTTGRRYWRPWNLPRLGAVELPVARKIDLLAHDDHLLYAAAGNRLFAIDLPLRGDKKPAWYQEVEGTIAHVAAAAGRVLVSTREGNLYCFGSEPIDPAEHRHEPTTPAPDDSLSARVTSILQTAAMPEGYCVVWGVGTGQLALELARRERLQVIVIEADAAKVERFRGQLLEAGLLGERIAVLPGSWQTVELPLYLASLMVAEDLENLEASPDCLRKLFASLRPYGGLAVLPVPAERRGEFESAIANAQLERARLRADPQGLALVREGALAGAADWTHQHGDAANTRVSKDRLVRAPLGLLWFGGPTHDGMLPRHGHGPQPQVCQGRLFIEGVDKLRAIDIYTGRLLWETALPGVGAAFDNTYHQAGANGAGSNYVSTPDGIYIVHGKACLRLDPASGRAIGQFRLPRLPGLVDADWGYLNVVGSYLVGGANLPARTARAYDATVATSKHLVVMDRYTGKVLWTATARHGFRHNGICVGKGRLYAIDRATSDWWERRGESSDPARMAAFDLASGKPLWDKVGVFGTYLSHSEPYDVLVESGITSRDTLMDEASGVRAYRGNGALLWHQPDYVGPAMVQGDRILLGGSTNRQALRLEESQACELRTGKLIQRSDPLTGLATPWGWSRGYGCNLPMASTHLLTFRSGAAGYFDLAGDGGTGNWGGFRSGCTNNLIVAGGVLCAPDYTRTCVCNYQNQTSLALVPMADTEMWTWFGARSIDGPIRRLGINLGAPGNRKAADGTLWLEYPFVGGPSYRPAVALTPEKPDWFQRHSSWVDSGELKWVAASGARGLRSLTLGLDAGLQAPERRFTVRLHFLEPDDLKPGQRLFHVNLQGERVLTNFDIAREAGGARRGLVKEFRDITVTRDLTVTLIPAATGSAPVLCGVEVRLESAERP